MASGSFTSAMTGSYGVGVKWNSTPDVETNTSTFVMETYVLHPYMNISGRTASTTIDGNTKTFNTPARKSDASPWLVNTRTVTIQHDDDGTKSIAVSASFPFDLDSTAHGRIRTKKASATCVLDNIPRASEVSSQTANVVANSSNMWSLVMSKHSDNFRHIATLTFGSNTYITPVFDTTVRYAVPISWLTAIPNARSGTVTVAIQTYSDESCTTAIGDPVYTSFTVSAPDSAAPEISSGWATVAPANTGNAAGMTVYIQGVSTALVTFDASKVSAKYGATIASVVVEWNNIKTIAAPYKTALLTKSGAQIIRCIVTDSRGMQSVQEKVITVQPYSAPTLSDIAIYRCDSSGNEDDAGAFLYFRATANISECAGENTVTVNAAYKPVVNTLWTNTTEIESGVGSVLGAGAISSTTSYNARITATDRLGKTASITVTISTTEAAFNLKKGGKGGAFGKYAETDGLLDCAWAFFARGGIDGVTNYVKTETDTGGWYGEEKVYRRIVQGTIDTANASTLIGQIPNLSTVISMQGYLRGSGRYRALTDYYVTTAGVVYATAPGTGTAYMMVVYTKSEE